MRTVLALAIIGLAVLPGCAPISEIPVRVVDSPGDVAACRRIGTVGTPVRTNDPDPDIVPSPGFVVAGRGLDRSPYGPVLGESLEGMRQAAFARGGTDLLLSKRYYSDWSYVEGVAFRCRDGVGRGGVAIRARS
jgi:hypothetical protein